MISNNSCRKLPTGRISCDRNKHDIKSMKNANLRKTYILFSQGEADTENMSLIINFEDFQIYTNAGRAFSFTVNTEADRKWENYRNLQENRMAVVESWFYISSKQVCETGNLDYTPNHRQADSDYIFKSGG